MLRKLLLCLILGLLLNSCAKERTYEISNENGVEVVRNTGKANNEKLTVDLELISTIRGYDEIENPDTLSFFNVHSLVFDNSDNIYFFDQFTYKILKYDQEGKLLLSFGERGAGPGQIMAPISIISLTDSTIVVSDWGKNHYFDSDGKFIRTVVNNSRSIPTYRLNIGNDEHIEVLKEIKIEGKSYMNTELVVKSIADGDDERKALDAGVKYEQQEGRGKYVGMHTITHSKDKLFVSIMDFNKYQIEVYDFDFNQLQEIKMNYTLRKFSVEENKKLMEPIQNIDFSNSFLQRGYYDDLYSNKLALFNLHYDESQDLVIVENQGDVENLTVTFDIFKDGVYLNSFTIPIDWEDISVTSLKKSIYFKNGKMYSYKSGNNSIEIYKITYNF